MKLLRFAASRCLLSTAISRQRPNEHAGGLNVASYGTTVNQSEVEQLSKLSNVWWDPAGEVRALHAMNHLRVQLVVDGLANVGVKSEKPFSSLEGFEIMDVGCGGGILSEALVRAGANVVGLDPSEDLICVAKQHSAIDPWISGRLSYVRSVIEEFSPKNEEKFDAVIASEVIEHVNDTQLFVENCVRVLKPGGSLFITTVNRTFVSWLAGIILAEHILKLIPKGTHDWQKFITPEETQRLVEAVGCRTKLIHGMMYNPMMNLWTWTKNTQICYALHAVKSKNQP